MNPLAQAVDSAPQRAGAAGYVAERHPLIPDIVLVWAPCGCVLGANAHETFLTVCAAEECVFVWSAAKDALDALWRAEHPDTPSVVVEEPRDAAADLSTITHD